MFAVPIGPTARAERVRSGVNARETETRGRVRSRSGTYRSFTDEHGLKNSALAYIVTPSGARRLILTMGVSPIV
jgi:hypothetical protein